MKTEHVPIDSVRVDAANVRKHSKRNLETIKRSLEAFGQQKPIVVTADGLVVAGNGTLDAARALGWTHIDVVRTGLEGSARKAYAVADNRTAELAEWDEGGLGELLVSLQRDETFDETVTGFDEREIERLIGAGEVVEDEAPPAPEVPITKPGDLWLLGDHRVLCGDALVEESWSRLPAAADLLLIDPPYGELRIFDAKGRVGQDNVAQAKQYGAYENEGSFDLEPLLPIVASRVKSRIIWGGNYFRLPIRTSWLCWEKRAGERSWFSDFELAWSDLPITARLFKHIWQGMIREGTDGERHHPTQKPIALFVWCIKLADAPSIMDGFLGSGTTLIAAEQLGRKCYGIEIEPRYVDVTLKRWANLTGKSPIREADGKTLAELEHVQ